jgi:hypothetical protein
MTQTDHPQVHVRPEELTPEVERDKTVVVSVPKDSRLETLLCLWESAKEKADAAEGAYSEIKDGILHELQELYPEDDIKTYDIPGGKMYPPLTYTFSKIPYLPAPKIREHLEPIWDAFKQYKRSWRLTKKGKR